MEENIIVPHDNSTVVNLVNDSNMPISFNNGQQLETFMVNTKEFFDLLKWAYEHRHALYSAVEAYERQIVEV